MDEKTRVTIVGLGAVGGSCAMALRAHGCHVTALDRDPKTIAYAMENGLIDIGVDTGEMDSTSYAPDGAGIRGALGRADKIILGLYPDRILSWLRVYRTLFTPGAVVTDVAAVKGGFLEEAQALMPLGCEFISVHPMAGIPGRGVWAARAHAFKGTNFIIVPTAQNTARGIGFAQWLGKALNAGAITILGAAEHDSLVGYASQLPHALAVCLMTGSGDHRIPNVAGASYIHLAGIADVNVELWSEVFLANTPVLTRQIGAFIDSLSDLRRRLTNGDRDGLKQFLERSARHSRAFSESERDAEGYR